MKGKWGCVILMMSAAVWFGLWMKSWEAGLFMANALGMAGGLAIRMYEDRHKEMDASKD